MAYKGKGKKGYYGRSKGKYTEIEKLAYNMGRIETGLKNPDSRVYESYHNGCSGKKDKKSLF